MKQLPILTKVIIGAALGLIAAITFQLTEPVSVLPESINLIHALSTLAVTIPGIIASLVNWDLFIALSAVYGAGVGYLFGRLPQRSRFLALLLLLVHFLSLVFIDFIIPRLLKSLLPF